MSTKERILMIRLMEKLQKHPAYAKVLGVGVTGTEECQSQKNDQKDLTDS